MNLSPLQTSGISFQCAVPSSGERFVMITVITHVDLPDGLAPEWDESMRARMEAAESCEGWIAGQLLIPLTSLNSRVIVGVWESRSHWEAWHAQSAFSETAERLDELGAPTGETEWYETVYDARSERHAGDAS